jgi:hypothetical protein
MIPQIFERPIGGGLSRILMAHDLSRKPAPIPDQIEKMLFGIKR